MTAQAKPTPGEICPRHGQYLPNWQAAALRRRATQPDVPTDQARMCLEHAEKIRRTCPGCGGQRPANGEWAAEVRGARG